MKLRFPQSLHDELHESCERYGIKKLSDFCNTALRKFNRVGTVADLKQIKMATCDTSPITVRIKPEIIGSKTPTEIRKALQWYLDDLKSKRRIVTPPDIKEDSEAIKKANRELQRLAVALANY